VAIEKTPPYDLAVYRSNDVQQERGAKDWRRALDRIRMAMQSGQWPGKQAAPQDLDLPAWVQYE
jgi:hypothetical protein